MFCLYSSSQKHPAHNKLWHQILAQDQFLCGHAGQWVTWAGKGALIPIPDWLWQVAYERNAPSLRIGDGREARCLHHIPHIACDTLHATHRWHTLCWHTRTDSPYTSLPEGYVHTLLWHVHCNTQDSEWWSHTHAMPPHYKTRWGEWQGARTLMPAGPRRCLLQYS